jgi:hypothetical protein
VSANRLVAVLIMSAMLLASPGHASADIAPPEESNLLVWMVGSSDADGRGSDARDPTAIGQRLNVSIELINQGSDESRMIIQLIPVLDGYSTISTPAGDGDIPKDDPSERVELSRSMDELYDVLPPGAVVIYELKEGERTNVNFTVILRTAGTWNLGVLVTVQNGTSYLFSGNTVYVAMNEPRYLDALTIAIPFILGGASLGLAHLYRKRHRMDRDHV